MRLSARTKLLFFFLFNLSCWILPMFALAQEEEDTAEEVFLFDWERIDHTWLDLRLNEFEFQRRTGAVENFVYYSGGKFLSDFETLPLEDIDKDFVLVKSIATFNFSINAYTKAGITDVFPNANFGNVDDDTWVEWAKFKRVTASRSYDKFKKPYRSSVEDILGRDRGIHLSYHKAKYNYKDIDLDGDGKGYREDSQGRGEKNAKFNSHRFDGVLPITMVLREPFSLSNVELNGYKFSTVGVASDFLSATVIKVEDGITGDYKDEIVTDEGQIEFKFSVTRGRGTFKPSGTSGKGSPANHMKNRGGLGFRRKNSQKEITYPYGDTGHDILDVRTVGTDLYLTRVDPNTQEVDTEYQQEADPKKEEEEVFEDLEEDGKDLNEEQKESASDDPIVNEPIANNIELPIDIKPSTTIGVDSYEHKKAWYWWDYHDFLGSPADYERVQTKKYSNKRCYKVHVYNRFVKTTIEVKVGILAICNKEKADKRWDADFSGTNLDDPYFKRGDFIWDDRLGGTTEFEGVFRANPFQDFLDFFGNIGEFFENLLGLGEGGSIILLIVAIIVIIVIIGVIIVISRNLSIGGVSRALRKSRKLAQQQALMQQQQRLTPAPAPIFIPTPAPAPSPYGEGFARVTPRSPTIWTDDKGRTWVRDIDGKKRRIGSKKKNKKGSPTEFYKPKKE